MNAPPINCNKLTIRHRLNVLRCAPPAIILKDEKVNVMIRDGVKTPRRDAMRTNDAPLTNAPR